MGGLQCVAVELEAVTAYALVEFFRGRHVAMVGTVHEAVGDVGLDGAGGGLVYPDAVRAAQLPLAESADRSEFRQAQHLYPGRVALGNESELAEDGDAIGTRELARPAAPAADLAQACPAIAIEHDQAVRCLGRGHDQRRAVLDDPGGEGVEFVLAPGLTDERLLDHDGSCRRHGNSIDGGAAAALEAGAAGQQGESEEGKGQACAGHPGIMEAFVMACVDVMRSGWC